MKLQEQLVAVYEAAAARLDTKGWQRTDLGTRYGPNCVAGAIWFEAQELAASRPEAEVLDQMAVDMLGNMLGGLITKQGVVESAWVPYWNDYECRDGAEAADKLREAAKEAAKGWGV